MSGEIDYIVAPKRPCPMDLGYWYCDKCLLEWREEQAESEYPIKHPPGCRVALGSLLMCGKTHRGHMWCNECQERGTFEPRAHIGEWVTVGTIKSD